MASLWAATAGNTGLPAGRCYIVFKEQRRKNPKIAELLAVSDKT
jgi:hypothetical protein